MISGHSFLSLTGIEYLDSEADITTLPTFLTGFLVFIGILYGIVVMSLLMYLYSRRNKWQKKQNKKIQDYIEEDNISEDLIGLEFQINRFSLTQLEDIDNTVGSGDVLTLSVGDAETLSGITSTRFTGLTSGNPSSNESGRNLDVTSSWGFRGTSGRRVY